MIHHKLIKETLEWLGAAKEKVLALAPHVAPIESILSDAGVKFSLTMNGYDEISAFIYVGDKEELVRILRALATASYRSRGLNPTEVPESQCRIYYLEHLRVYCYFKGETPDAKCRYVQVGVKQIPAREEPVYELRCDEAVPRTKEPMCEHGFIGACAECDGSGQTPEPEEAQ